MSQSEGRITNISGAVLVGGASTRMGEDKSLTLLGGIPLATRIYGTLDTLFEDVMLVGNDPPDELPGRRVPDGVGLQCALRGLIAALDWAETERVLVVATDLPLVTPALLLALLAAPEADVVVPETADGLQPLCALYRIDPALRRAHENIRSSRLAMRSLIYDLDTYTLDAATVAELDPDGNALLNVNTPEDLAAATTALAARDPSR